MASRRELFQAFTSAGVTVVGAEWHDDWAVEKAFHAWQSGGAPRNAVVILQRAGAGELEVLVEDPLKEAPAEMQEPEEELKPIFLE